MAALVYIAAFAPGNGESVSTLIADPPPGASVPPILPPRDGVLFLDREKFHASFAGDRPAEAAAFMADSQVPWGVDALGGSITEAAWRTKPSWYLVATEDRMIPPPVQSAMSERAGSTVIEGADGDGRGVGGEVTDADQIGAESLPKAGRVVSAARGIPRYATVNAVGARSSLAGSRELTRSDRRRKAVLPCDDPELSWPRPW